MSLLFASKHLVSLSGASPPAKGLQGPELDSLYLGLLGLNVSLYSTSRPLIHRNREVSMKLLREDHTPRSCRLTSADAELAELKTAVIVREA